MKVFSGGLRALQGLSGETDKFLLQLFDESPIGLNLCRMNDGVWLASNQAFIDMIGYSNEEADGALTYWDLTPRKYDDQEAVQLQQLEEHGKYGPYEKEFIHKRGHLVPVRLNGFITIVKGERYIWSFIEDITVEKQAQASATDQT